MRNLSVIKLVLFFALLIFIRVNGQVNFDSLISEINNEKADSVKYSKLDKYGIELLRNYPEKTISYVKEELQKDSFIQNIKYELILLQILNSAYIWLDEYEKAILIGQEIIEKASIACDSVKLFRANNNIGRCYDGLSDFNNALSYYLKGIIIAEQLKNEEHISYAYSNIGAFFNNNKDYISAIKYFIKAEEVSKKNADNYVLSTIYSNLSLSYNNIKKYDSALIFGRQSYNISRRINKKETIPYALNNIGDIFKNMNQLDSAFFYFSLSNQKFIENQNKLGIAVTDAKIGQISLQENDISKARFHAEKSLNIVLEVGNKEFISKTYNLLSKIEEKSSNFQKSLEYYKKYSDIQDSVFNETKSKQIAELQTQYETDKKEQHITLLETENELKQSEIKQREQQRNWITVLFVVLLIISVIIYFYYKKTKEAKIKIESLQREIHHRVKNNLSIAIRLVEVTKDSVSSPEDRKSLDELINRISSIAQLHSLLHQKQDVTQVDLYEYLESISKNLLQTFNTEKFGCEIFSKEHIDIDFGKAVPIGLIFHELVTNSYKHAGGADQKIQVKTKITVNNSKIQFEISDNGVGFGDDFNFVGLKTYGLKLVNGLTQQLDAKIIFENLNGAKILLEIPS